MTIPAAPSPVPADTPLREVTDDLDRSGHPGQFQALEGGELRCLTCGEHFPAAEESADRVTRLEGASDPSDMAIIVPMQCPHCATRGTLVASYGPEASAAEADVLVALQRDPAAGAHPQDEPTPGVR